MNIRHLTIPRFAEISGYSEHAIRSKIKPSKPNLAYASRLEMRINKYIQPNFIEKESCSSSNRSRDREFTKALKKIKSKRAKEYLTLRVSDIQSTLMPCDHESHREGRC